MAGAKGKKTSKKKGEHWDPVHRFLRYKIASTTDEQSRFIDIAKDLSELNRKMFRQGRTYKIKNWYLEAANSTNDHGALRVSLSTAPNNWVTKGAWNAGYKAWRHQVDSVLEAANEVGEASEGTWTDYKIYLTEEMRDSVATDGLLRVSDNKGNASVLGEWQHVEYHQPLDNGGLSQTDTYTAHLLGPDTAGSSPVTNPIASMGLITNYALARATVSGDSPNLQSDFPESLFFKLYDEGFTMDEIAESIQKNNDDPPYPIDQYIGGAANMPGLQMISRQTISSPGAAPSQDTGGVGPAGAMSGTRNFEVPLGMLEVEFIGQNDGQNFDLIIEIAPGDYKGVYGPTSLY